MTVIAFPMDALFLVALLPALLLPTMRKATGGGLLGCALAVALLSALIRSIPLGAAFPLALAGDNLSALLLFAGLLACGLPDRFPAKEILPPQVLSARIATGILALATLTVAAVVALKTPAPAFLAAAIALMRQPPCAPACPRVSGDCRPFSGCSPPRQAGSLAVTPSPPCRARWPRPC